MVEAKKRQTPAAAGLEGLPPWREIYFPDPTLAGAFVARWFIGYKIETAEGAFRVHEDEPTPRAAARLHRTP